MPKTVLTVSIIITYAFLCFPMHWQLHADTFSLAWRQGLI